MAKPRNRLEKLWRRDPFCHWCGCRTKMPPRRPGGFPKMATLDHLFSRPNPVRIIQGLCPVVLACQRCNSTRSAYEMARLGVVKLRRIDWRVPPPFLLQKNPYFVATWLGATDPASAGLEAMIA